jgi:hypothetical protein
VFTASSFRKSKSCQILQKSLFEKKAWVIPCEKCHFLLDMNFLDKEASIQILHEQSSAHYLPDDATDSGVWWMND